jgi:hypothetical protein
MARLSGRCSAFVSIGLSKKCEWTVLHLRVLHRLRHVCHSKALLILASAPGTNIRPPPALVCQAGPDPVQVSSSVGRSPLKEELGSDACEWLDKHRG